MRQTIVRWAMPAFAALCAGEMARAAEPERSAHMQPAAHCAKIEKADVIALFDRWNAALSLSSVDAMASLYASDAIMTVPGRAAAYQGADAIRAHLKTNRFAPREARVEQRIVSLSCNAAVDAGTVRIVPHGAPENTSAAPQQFRFVYEFRNGRWQIVHHHMAPPPDTANYSVLAPRKPGQATHTAARRPGNDDTDAGGIRAVPWVNGAPAFPN
jgi:uncharacterized protein (TIGR02246 family)